MIKEREDKRKSHHNFISFSHRPNNLHAYTLSNLGFHYFLNLLKSNLYYWIRQFPLFLSWVSFISFFLSVIVFLFLGFISFFQLLHLSQQKKKLKMNSQSFMGPVKTLFLGSYVAPSFILNIFYHFYNWLICFLSLIAEDCVNFNEAEVAVRVKPFFVFLNWICDQKL